jgi:hypothetical protein
LSRDQLSNATFFKVGLGHSHDLNSFKIGHDRTNLTRISLTSRMRFSFNVISLSFTHLIILSLAQNAPQRPQVRNTSPSRAT